MFPRFPIDFRGYPPPGGAAPGGHSGRDWEHLCTKKSHEMGLESSYGSEHTTKMHSKTSPTQLEGSRGARTRTQKFAILCSETCL